jgi:predicted esterase
MGKAYGALAEKNSGESTPAPDRYTISAMHPKIIPREQAITIPSYYLRANEGESKPLLLLAHGFSDSGASFLRRIAPALDDRFEVLAPNGLFPQPIRQEGTWKEAYAWYFADLEKKKIFIHPDVSAGAVTRIVEDLGLVERPKILIGFSQGGYFLPFLASRLRGVRRLIMIGAGFRPDDFELLALKLPVSAIHGDADNVIDAAESQEEFGRLGARNTGGEFHLIPGMTHSIDDHGRAKLRELLAETN